MDESNKKHIINVIMQKQTVTVPEIQNEFNVGYFDAKSIVNELIANDNLSFKSGIIYEVQKEDDSDDDIFSPFDKDKEPLINPKFGGPFPPRHESSSRFSSDSRRIPVNRRIVTEFGSRVFTMNDETRAKIAKLDIISCSNLKKIVDEVSAMRRKGSPILHVYTHLNVSINEKILKFEFIEGLLKNNDLRTKKEWVAKMQEECNILKDYAPTVLKGYIDEALKEFKGLTLANIKATKKIVDDDKVDLDVDSTTVETDDDDDDGEE